MSDTSTTQPGDVITEILRDHEEIKSLFGRVSGASGGAKRDAFEALVRKIAVHETAEEEVVHPAARTAGEDVVEERLAEEHEGKEVLSELEQMGVDDPRFDSTFSQFERAVLAHAKSEEREEHPRLRQAVEAERLQQMGRVFRAAEATAPTHPHPHGPDSAIGNLAVGPIASIIDRTRDAIRNARRDDDGGVS
jgi:hemerythrin superfamily protein